MFEVQSSEFDVIIIGAGMAGLAAGIRLALAGKQSLILERHNASGGLNSFYSIDGRKYDVGLHAMTNFVPKGTKGTPLTKLLRQLRIPYDALSMLYFRKQAEEEAFAEDFVVSLAANGQLSFTKPKLTAEKLVVEHPLLGEVSVRRDALVTLESLPDSSSDTNQ